MKTLPHIGSLVLLSILVGGCHSSSKTAEFVGRPYPIAANSGTVLDVQVFKHPTTIEFTNTTARAFNGCFIWLNGRYQRQVETIGIGQTLTLDLREFKDEFGQPFGSGGFWAANDPERLVLTQIEVTDGTDKPQLLGLITIREDE